MLRIGGPVLVWHTYAPLKIYINNKFKYFLGGESIWGKPFRDEFHSRLRFVRRGLVAMANAGRVLF